MILMPTHAVIITSCKWYLSNKDKHTFLPQGGGFFTIRGSGLFYQSTLFATTSGNRRPCGLIINWWGRILSDRN